MSLVACVFTADRATASSTGEILGRVTDASSHAGVAGASVAAMSTTGTYHAVTDRNGYYSIVNAFPNAYLVSVSAGQYQPAQLLAGSVNPEQATVVDVQLDKSQSNSLTGSPSNPLSIFRPNQASEQFVLTAAAADATNGSGGSYGLYQAPGIAGTLPGVTLDSGVNVHVRGGRLDEVGYEYDGINAVDPLTGLTATNLIQDGIVRFKVDETAASTSAASGPSGTVNSVVSEGSYPARGSVTLLVQAPTFYHGMNFDYGSATPDNRFSWFLSGVLWNSGYDWGNRASFVPGAESTELAFGDGPVGDVSPSRDAAINLHYRPGTSGADDIQFLASNGYERFDNAMRPLFWPSTNPLHNASTNPTPVNGLCNVNNLALFPGQPNCTAGTGEASDNVDQGYSIDKFQYTHDLRSNASLALKFATVDSNATASIPFGDGPFADLWQNRHSSQQQLGAELAAQVGSKNFVRGGIDQDRSANYLRSVFVSGGFAAVTPANSSDRTYWAIDTFRPSAKSSLDISARNISRTYYRVAAPAFADAGSEAQLGASYSVDPQTVLRASFGNHVELPFVSRVERIITRAPNFGDISSSNQIQAIEGEPGAAQSHAYDVSVERALQDGTTLKVTPFWRTSSDLLVNYGAQLAVPQAAGRYDVNGVDAEVQIFRAAGALGGYIDYTHTRAIAGATGDFNQPIGLGAAQAHALFPVSFIAPDVANLVITWHRQRWTINPELSYSSGFPYGVGRFTYNSLNCPNSTSASTGDPTRPCGAVVRNGAAYSDSNAGDCGPGLCAKLIDPGETGFADGRVCCAALTANMNISYRLAESTTVGLQWENLNRAYGALALTQNPYFPSSPYGAPGFNGYFNYGAAPYVPAAINNSEEFLFTITQKT